MAQLTAIEWLINEIAEKELRTEIEWKEIFEQVKAMEKEQIVKAWDERGSRIVPRYFLEENINGEQYYNETYGK
jgi:DNA-binding transcriptional regulator YdaS (Cro superfamily)